MLVASQQQRDPIAGADAADADDLAREVEQMNAKGLSAYGRLCGWTLARAHARSGDRIAIAAYLGSGSHFDRAMLEFSHAYAQQNERDYKALAAAVKSGRLTAETGV